MCQLDPIRREVCCLSGAWVRDITKKLPSLLQPTDDYPLLVFQVGNDQVQTTRMQMGTWGQLVKGSGAPVVLSSILPVSGIDGARNRKTRQMNNWL